MRTTSTDTPRQRPPTLRELHDRAARGDADAEQMLEAWGDARAAREASE